MTTWPKDLSRLILDYAGYIQTSAQIARDELIGVITHCNKSRVTEHMRRISKNWKEYVQEGAMDHASATASNAVASEYHKVYEATYWEVMGEDYERLSPESISGRTFRIEW